MDSLLGDFWWQGVAWSGTAKKRPITPRQAYRAFQKKLRDVLQEREGTSLNYIKVLFNYIEQFSRSILIFVYLCLFWTILVYLSASQCILVYLCLTRSILVYLSLSWSILDYIRLYWTILNYLELSWTISDNL